MQDRILNHIDHSVSAIYDQHRYDAEARVWLQKWAGHLEALTVSNVVPLRVAEGGFGYNAGRHNRGARGERSGLIRFRFRSPT